DALELIYAGASAVQICTVAMKEGPKAFKRIDDELRDALERLGHQSVEECRGLAHQL
ncbi:MAG: diguanylate cyclase, partial [Chloroflexi bacterium]|nr:diguanylate cyclase [Chloroflexota bacterium]